MYAKAFRIFASNISIFLVFSLASTVLEEMDRGFSFTGISVMLSGLLALYCHRMILHGDDFGWEQIVAKRSALADDIRIWPFMWRLIVSTLLLLALVFAIFFLLRGFFAQFIQGPDAEVVGYFLSAFIAIPFAGVALALFGTVFPAAAINEDASLGAALERGKKRFWITLWRLFFGFFCFTAVAMSAYAAMTPYFGYETADDGVIYYVASFLLTLSGSFSTLLGATALSLAYEETQFKNPF